MLRAWQTGNASGPYPFTPSSGDILTSLNVPTKTLPPFSLTTVAASRHVPFLHIFTPGYSPHLAALAPLRRELGFPTIFHSFSSLISPTRRDYIVIGVHDASLGRVFAEGCRSLGVKRAWVVYGEKDALDAISPEGTTKVWDVNPGNSGQEITERTISAEVFGCLAFPLSKIQLPPYEETAGSYAFHAKVVNALLSQRRLANNTITLKYSTASNGPEGDPQERTWELDLSALEDWVCLNAAALIFISGKAKDEQSAFISAKKSLRDGKAAHVLEALRDAAALAVDVDALDF